MNEPTDGEVAARQLGPQRVRVLRQVADRAELERADARRLDLVEHVLPAAGCSGESAKSTPQVTGPVASLTGSEWAVSSCTVSD